MTVVLDTSALLLWTLDPSQMSQRAHTAIAGAEIIVVSSISLWEIALKVKRERIDIPIPIEEYVDQLTRVAGLEIQAVDVRTWLDNVALNWDHRDPADRTVVALAARLECPLISSDRTIRDFYPKTIW